MNQLHKNNFNFLRILAAIFVATSHSFYLTGNETHEPLGILTEEYLEFSTVGLLIFFFISGYLVRKSAEESKNALAFLKKRALRIYPALIVVVLCSVFVAGPILTSLPVQAYFTHRGTFDYLWTLSGLRIRFFLPGVYEAAGFIDKGFNGSLWSIQLELKLYLSLLLLLVLGLIRNKRIIVFISLAVITGCFAMYYCRWYNFLLPDHKHLALTATFYLGVLMNTIVLKNRYLLSAFIVSGLLMGVRFAGLIHTDLLIDQVVFFSLLSYFAAFTRRLSLNLNNDLSYGLYIYTFPLQQLFFQLTKFNSSAALNMALSLVGATVIAFFSWKYIEKPALKLKYRRL